MLDAYGLPRQGGGVITLVGAYDAEASTTSASLTDLITISGIVPVNSSLLMVASLRLVGATNDGQIGIKINATQVMPTTTWTNGLGAGTTNGFVQAWIFGHDATYTVPAFALMGSTGANALITQSFTTAIPNQPITNFTLSGLSTVAGGTMAAKYMRVYIF